jgi:hypothetical protein
VTEVNKGSAVVLSGVVGSVAGVLTRPCCIVPIALAGLGVSSAAAADFAAAYRRELRIGSVGLLGSSAVVTFRREGGVFAKCFTVAASLVAFALSRLWMGVL